LHLSQTETEDAASGLGRSECGTLMEIGRYGQWQRGQQEEGQISFGQYFRVCRVSSQKCSCGSNQGRATGGGQHVELLRE